MEFERFILCAAIAFHQSLFLVLRDAKLAQPFPVFGLYSLFLILYNPF
jgi:hypothetical protein